jgi:hypothetical protein
MVLSLWLVVVDTCTQVNIRVAYGRRFANYFSRRYKGSTTPSRNYAITPSVTSIDALMDDLGVTYLFDITAAIDLVSLTYAHRSYCSTTILTHTNENMIGISDENKEHKIHK